MATKLEHTKELLTFKTHKFFEGGKDFRTHKQANFLPPIVGGMKKLSALVATEKRWDYGGSRDPVIMSKQKNVPTKKNKDCVRLTLEVYSRFPPFLSCFSPKPKTFAIQFGRGSLL